MSIEGLTQKQLLGLQNYYQAIYKLKPVEQENMLLAPQFEMFNNQIRLTTFDKLNILERETV